MFSGIVVRVLCVEIIHHLFFWVPYFVRNVLTKYDIFSQSARPVGKLNQLVHRGFFFRDSMILV